MSEPSLDNPKTFKWSIAFKDPDSCGEFSHFADTAKHEALKATGMDDDEIAEKLYEDPTATSKRFFQWGEYGVVELELGPDGTGTARLIPL